MGSIVFVRKLVFNNYFDGYEATPILLVYRILLFSTVIVMFGL